MNAYAANQRGSAITAFFLTVGAGFVPYAGVVLPALVATWFVSRNRENRGLCILLIVVAVIFALLWIAYFAWQGGGSSIHHNHSTKVP